MDKEEKKDIWWHWKNLTTKKIPVSELNPDDLSTYDCYQMNKILSMINIYIEHAVELSMLDLPKEAHYNYLFHLLPQSFIKIDYIKAKKDAGDYKLVSEYFEFGSRDLRDALKILKEDDIKKIKRKFGGIRK